MSIMLRAFTAGIAVAALATGCKESASDVPTPPPADLRPVTDSVPYLCDLVPEQAWRQVTGLTASVNARWVNGPQADNGLCLADAAGLEAPLGIEWTYNDGERILGVQQRAWDDRGAHPIPKELGRGLAGVAQTAGGNPRPNFVVALFKCGKRKTLISIDFAPVVRGRDAVQDMVEFMRIAERRFGVVHGCTPG
ncbi:hypothetical protein J4573_25585 [Actinomadura barringtoniae]|uniref:DUF3558 domain-containing protein n=1 Tax=Actinomadura barringtoniae TaxID=1427535 RepID=A0A939PDA3_9ACTN|nr:hypothetical protein [Actinomadura barringtoniae]MBO2450500.1 hypothetical protein [Actinomadura barringtoniae]